MRWTRRHFLYSGIGAIFPSDWRRYRDPATEFEVYRLTDPAYTSVLPAYYGRTFSRHGDGMVFSSDRGGSMQAYRMDLRTGETRDITDVEALDPTSVSFTADERGVIYFDGRKFEYTALVNGRSRRIYEIPETWERGAGSSLTADGLSALFSEMREGVSRLRTVGLSRGTARTVLETKGAIEHPLARPRRAQILYRQGSASLWIVNTDGQQNRRLKLPDGEIGPARWAPDGRTMLYLLFPADRTHLHEIREYAPDTNVDRLVAKTSQFAHFGFNANTSVFVGASQNVASPTILILLRITRRELTLCEHKSSRPDMVAPVFSPDSQRIYFESDRHGKPAIYSVHVEKFVERTDEI